MADELERALLLRDLELMAQPRNPNAVQPSRASILDVGGIGQRLGLLNQIFNPVEAIGQSMSAGERMMSPNMGVMDRLAALGDMASGIAGVVAPVAAASRAGTPAATALMEGLLGGSPTQEAFGDTMRAVGRDVVDRLNQPGPMPTVYSNPIPGVGLPPMRPSEEILDLPDDEFVTLYHGTTREAAEKIRQTGKLKSAGEPSVYLTTDPSGAGYGDGTVVPVRVRRGLLQIDDEFPSGRTDFRIDLSRPGGSVPVQIAEPPQAPALPAPRNDAEAMALRLYHGSPHDFDRFSMSKIGTGEGAQAYGHGLYFAESEDVAKAYRDNIGTGVSYKGQPILANLQDGTMVNPIAARMSQTGEDAEAAIRSLAQKYRSDAQTVLRRGQTPYPGGDPVKFAAQYNQMADEVLAMNPADFGRSGRMYEVDVSANPEDFLDYDTPLSAQSETVQKAWADYTKRNPRWLNPEISGSQYENPTGSDFLGAYSEDVPHDPKDFFNYQRKFTEDLSQLGIPGIRYLDAGSRGAGTGTRNYVVFDENLINIVRKYGIAGAAAMLGVSAFDVEQAMAQGKQQPQGLLSTGVQ